MSAPANVEVKKCPKCHNAIGKMARICPVCGCSVSAAAVMRVVRWVVLAAVVAGAVRWFRHR